MDTSERKRIQVLGLPHDSLRNETAIAEGLMMPNIKHYLGDAGGHGHELRVMLQDDGTAVLLSHNPDTDELQRIVLLENQWQRLLCVLLETCGKGKCCYFRGSGICSDRPVKVEA